jgi:hypothetical protein
VAIRRDSTAKQQIDPAERRPSGAPLKPIRVVVRELTRPDGKKLKVEVPVYPPFQLEERPAGEPAAERAPEAPAPAPAPPARSPKEPRSRRR